MGPQGSGKQRAKTVRTVSDSDEPTGGPRLRALALLRATRSHRFVGRANRSGPPRARWRLPGPALRPKRRRRCAGPVAGPVGARSKRSNSDVFDHLMFDNLMFDHFMFDHLMFDHLMFDHLVFDHLTAGV